MKKGVWLLLALSGMLTTGLMKGAGVERTAPAAKVSASLDTSPPYRSAVVYPQYARGYLIGLEVHIHDEAGRPVSESWPVFLELYTDYGLLEAGIHPRRKEARFGDGGFARVDIADEGQVYVGLSVPHTEPAGLLVVSTVLGTNQLVSTAPVTRHVEILAGGGLS